MTSLSDSASTQTEAAKREAVVQAAPRSPAHARALSDQRRRKVGRGRATLVRRSFLVSDTLGFAIAFLLAEWIVGFGSTSPDDPHGIGTEIAVFFATLPLWLGVAHLYGLYSQDEERTDHSAADDVVPIFHVVTVAVWLFQGGAWLTGLAQPKFPKLFAFWALALLLVVVGRLLARQLCRRRPSYIQNTLIVGTDDVGLLIARKLLQHPEYGLNLVGFVDTERKALPRAVETLPFLGVAPDLPSIILDHDVERVIVAGHVEGTSHIETVHRLKRCDVQIDIVPQMFEVVTPDVDIHSVEGIPLLGLPPTRLSRSSVLIKRTSDIVVAVLLLILTLPLLAWIAWRIRRDSSGPVFFRQTRLALNMKEMTILKFRTMTVDADDEKHREYIKAIMDRRAEAGKTGLFKLERMSEITPFGRWLRKTSLDELPQLINVLRDDMSPVGPRPCLAYEVEHFEPHHFERFSVPAGITGLWQVTARARSTFVEALEMGVAYARGWSLGLDLWLLARTPVQLLSRKGTA